MCVFFVLTLYMKDMMGNLLSRKEKRYAQANGLCLVKSITSFLLMRREKMKKKNAEQGSTFNAKCRRFDVHQMHE